MEEKHSSEQGMLEESRRQAETYEMKVRLFEQDREKEKEEMSQFVDKMVHY